MHPIKAFCKEQKITYQEFADHVRSVNGTRGPSLTQVAGYCCGIKKIGPKMADRIHNAYPQFSREELIYYRKEHGPGES